MSEIIVGKTVSLSRPSLVLMAVLVAAIAQAAQAQEPPRDARTRVGANYRWEHVDGASANVRVWWRKTVARDEVIAKIIQDEMDSTISPGLVSFMGQAPLPDDRMHPPNELLRRTDNGGSPPWTLL